MSESYLIRKALEAGIKREQAIVDYLESAPWFVHDPARGEKIDRELLDLYKAALAALNREEDKP